MGTHVTFLWHTHPPTPEVTHRHSIALYRLRQLQRFSQFQGRKYESYQLPEDSSASPCRNCMWEWIYCEDHLWKVLSTVQIWVISEDVALLQYMFHKILLQKLPLPNTFSAAGGLFMNLILGTVWEASRLNITPLPPPKKTPSDEKHTHQTILLHSFKRLLGLELGHLIITLCGIHN